MGFTGAAELSLLVQMVPMVTVAENARDIANLKPLIDALDSPSPTESLAGQKAFRYLVGVLKSGRKENLPFGGSEAGP